MPDDNKNMRDVLGIQDGDPILFVTLKPDESLLMGCNPTAPGLDKPFDAGVFLAMLARHIVETLIVHNKLNPSLREQMHAEITKGFNDDMKMPDVDPTVKRVL